jgi:ubiquinone/menaquinone biosynthesis C-methylase UbiE
MKSVTDHPYREFERTGWEHAAASYAGSFESATALFAPALLDALGIRSGWKVLDVACGPGFVSGLAAARGAEVTGVDFSPNMLAQARRRHPSLNFQQADAEALPFDDGMFDAVAINFGVHHFPFPAKALSEGQRVLRTGGRLAFTTWAAPREHVLHSIFIDAVREAGGAAVSLPTPAGGAVNEISSCIGLLKEAGFQPQSARAELVKAHVTVKSAEHLVDMLEAGTVRMAATLRSQPRERRGAIVAAIEKAIAAYRDDGQYRIPFAALLAVGSK